MGSCLTSNIKTIKRKSQSAGPTPIMKPSLVAKHEETTSLKSKPDNHPTMDTPDQKLPEPTPAESPKHRVTPNVSQTQSSKSKRKTPAIVEPKKSSSKPKPVTYNLSPKIIR